MSTTVTTNGKPMPPKPRTWEIRQTAIRNAIAAAAASEHAFSGAERFGADTTASSTFGNTGVDCVRVAELLVAQAQAWATIALATRGGRD